MFSLGSFPEVGQKKKREERPKVGNNNGQLRIANATLGGTRKPPGPKYYWQRLSLPIIFWPRRLAVINYLLTVTVSKVSWSNRTKTKSKDCDTGVSGQRPTLGDHLGGCLPPPSPKWLKTHLTSQSTNLDKNILANNSLLAETVFSQLTAEIVPANKELMAETVSAIPLPLRNGNFGPK